MRLSILFAAMTISVTACHTGPEVMRVVNGRLVGGSYVEPEAYASFLSGAIAESTGDLKGALVAYAKAAQRDNEDPEIWTRIGEVRCKLLGMAPSPGPSDPDVSEKGVAEALDHALSIDGDYEPAWSARARCGLGAKDDANSRKAAEEATRRAALADPMAVEPQIAIARVDGEGMSGAARDRLVALTLVHRENTAAWDALASFARAHGDADLAARALVEALRVVPARKADAAKQALALAGDGELPAARLLAAAALEAPGPQIPPAVARLAIDDALAAGDLERARLGATRAHLGLDEVAGRALLLHDARLARALATPVAEADPHAAGARMVLAVAAARAHDSKALARAFEGAARASGPIPMAALLPFAEALADASSVEEARRMVDAMPHDPLLAGDALMARASVDLAARGVLEDKLLPLDARIELAARRREAPSTPDDTVDARHRLLALVLLKPADPETLTLAHHLLPEAGRDPLIAVSLARLALAGAANATTDAGAALRWVTVDPSDPLSAAAALDLAKRQGDAATIVPARARLTALARTPAEHALVAE